MMPSPKPPPRTRKTPKRIRRTALRAISADPRKKLIAELDRVFSLYIRARDGYKCIRHAGVVRCSGDMQCNHLISRAKLRLRWDERNAVCGCSSLNLWAHYNDADWRELWQRLYPDRVEYLMRLKNAPGKYPNSILKLMIREYERKLSGTVLWENPKLKKEVET